MKLSPVAERFVLHWGEMGTRWGINRSVAQVQALLYVAGKPLHAEEIMETLGLARSNVSTSLKELQGWGIVRIVHVMGDRRDYFESLRDVWEMFRTILAERKRREIDPTLLVLRGCVVDANASGETDSAARLGELLTFLETMTGWYDMLNRLPNPMLRALISQGDRVRDLLAPTAIATAHPDTEK